MKSRWYVRGLLGLGLMLASPLAAAFDLPALTRTLQQEAEVHGRFEQLRYLRSLPQPLRSHGRFVASPGGALLWHVQAPIEQKTLIDAEGLRHWDGQAWRADPQASRSPMQTALFTDLVRGRFDSLRQHFVLNLNGSAAQWQLRLDPDSAVMKKIFQRIDISGDAFVRTVVLHEAQGDRVEIRFEAMTKP